MAEMLMEDLSKKLDELEAQQSVLEGSLAEANARADKAEAALLVAKLNDKDREAFDALPEEDQTSFPTVSEEQRNELLEKGRKAISKRGEIPDEIQKRFETISKQLADAEKRASAAEAVAKRANEERLMVELQKRAEDEFAGLPGTVIEKANVLKSIETKLSKEEVAEVYKMLKAGNECLRGQMKEVGKSGGGETSDDAYSRIEKRAEVWASEKRVSKEKAVEQFLLTPEGMQLYNEYLEKK